MNKAIAFPFLIDFDLKTGQCASGKVQPTKRYVSNLLEQFADREAAQAIVDAGDAQVYEFFELEQIPEQPGELRYGTSIVLPGKVGDEYFMTKGHFHTVLETAEVYYCLSGEGAMLMETPEGDVDIQWLRPGAGLYIPPRWAHRSINTGRERLVTFFTFPANAGHDYGTIEQKGFRKILVERDGAPALVDNPRWK